MLSLLLPLAGVLASVASAVDVSTIIAAAKTSPSIVPNRYIVEFDNAQNAGSLSSRDASWPIRDSCDGADFLHIQLHDHVFGQLEARGVSYNVRQKYDSDVFSGASVQLDNLQDLTTLADMNGILNIYPVHFVQRPNDPLSDIDFAKTWASKTQTKRSETAMEARAPGKPTPSTPATIATAPAPTATGGGSMTIGADRSPLGPNGFSSNVMSGIDKLHAEGYRGKGMKVAVIDSGVDYTHPALGGCFGPGCKVVGGYDYVGDNYNGSNTPMPDNDPQDRCFGHGTLVAGIIGANSPNRYNISGVVPDAQLYAYRIFSCSQATSDDIIAMSIVDAYKAGVDVINLSLGEFASWSSSVLAVVSTNVANKGVTVVSAAGNGGLEGVLYVESPGSGSKVIAAGSVDNYIYPAQLVNTSTGYGPITYFRFTNITYGTYPITALSTVYPNNSDACVVTGQLKNTDLSGKVLIVQASTDPNCNVINLIGNLYYNTNVDIVLEINLPGTAPLYSNGYPFPYASISPKDGQYLLGQLAAGKGVNLTFTDMPVTVPNTLTGNYTSIFSGSGPTNDLYIKPQVLAPGGNIVTLAPINFNGGYGFSSGTSYSSPYVAGVAALYMAANGGRDQNPPAKIFSVLENFAKILPVSVSDQSIETVAVQGSGFVQAYTSVKATSLISPSELLLNDTAYFNGEQTLTVTNNGNKKVKYSFSHTPADSIFALMQGSNESAYGPNLPEASSYASVKITPPVLNLQPGKSGSVRVHFGQPGGLDASRFPIYSGFVAVAGDNGESSHVPYLGVAAAMKKLPILDFTDHYGFKLPAIVDSNGNPQTAPQTYTLKNGDVPTLYYRLWGGSRVLLADLVKPNTTLGFTPTIAKRDPPAGPKGPLGGLLWALKHYKGDKPGKPGKPDKPGKGGPPQPPSPPQTNTFEQVPVIGNVLTSLWNSRNDGPNPAFNDGNGVSTFTFSGTFTNGTAVPNGSYQMLLRALKVTGDANLEADYESWLSPIFTIQQ